MKPQPQVTHHETSNEVEHPASLEEALKQIERLEKVLDETKEELHSRQPQRTNDSSPRANFYSHFINNSPDGVFILDQDTRFLEANPAACEMTGYDLEELKGIKMFDLVANNRKEEARRLIQAFLLKGKMKIDGVFHHKDGHKFYVAIDAIRLDHDTIIGYCKDISARILAEKQLIESEGRLKMISSAAEEGIVIHDKGVILDGNNALVRMFGFDNKQELIGRNIQDFLTTKDWQMVREKMKEADGGPYTCKALTLDKGFIHCQVVGKSVTYNGRDCHAAVLRDITAQTVAEEALRSSEAKFRAVVANAEAIIFMIDNDGQFAMSEGRGLATLGLKPGEVVGQSAFEIYKNYPEVISAIRRALNGELVRAILKIGQIWFDVFYSPFKDGEGNITGTLGMAVDITERKEAEHKLLHREQTLNLIFNNTHDSMLFLKVDDEQQISISAANDMFVKSQASPFGLKKSNLVGMPLKEYLTRLKYSPENEAFVMQRMLKVINEQKQVEYIETIEFADGLHYMDSSLSPVLDNQRNCINILYNARDITEKRNTEEALKRQHNFLLKVINLNPNLIFAKNREGRFTMVNEAVAKMYGTIPEKLIGQLEYEISDNKEEVEAFLSDDLEVMDSLKPKVIEEETLSDAEGHVHILKTVKTPLLDEDGTANQVLGVSTDITEQKMANVRLQKALEGQEEIVKERTDELLSTVSELHREIVDRKQIEKRLKASLNEKEILFNEVSHRVKNNLQIITSLMSLQLKTIENEEVLSLFKQTEHRIKSMALIHETLYKSQNFSEINFKSYLADLNAYVAATFMTPNVNMEIEVEDFNLSIESATTCGMICMELLTNSFKYAFPDNRAGVVRVRFVPITKDDFELIISDDGIGIPESIDYTETESLGMQLVCGLVEQLDGTIELDRSEGTTFKMKLTDRRRKLFKKRKEEQ